MYYFLKIGSKKSVSNFVIYIIKFIWFKPGDTEPYPGASLGTLVLCKGLICLYKQYFVIHLNRIADKGIHIMPLIQIF